MRIIYFLLLCCLIMACESKPPFRVIKFPENRYQNFSRLVTSSERWLAYPDEKKVLLFSSFQFGSADDSVVIADSVWDYCMALWEIRCEKNGEEIYELERPTGFMAERFADLNIDRVKIFGDSLLFCLVKLCYNIKSSKRNGLFAIYPLVCYDLKTRTFRNEYLALHTFDDSKRPYARDISSQLPIQYSSDGFHYLAYGYFYDSSGGSLRFSNDIEIVAFDASTSKHLCKTDTIAKIIDFDITRDELIVSVRNQFQRFKNGELKEVIETGLKPGISITDYLEIDKNGYYVVYEKKPELYASIYKRNEARPIYSGLYESASLKLQYWNGHYYFFYDEDAVTYAIEF